MQINSSVRAIFSGDDVTKRSDEMAEIEATQAALRESIEATKGLAEKAETLLQKHKMSLDQDRGEADAALP